jgi:hypothetical protein
MARCRHRLAPVGAGDENLVRYLEQDAAAAGLTQVRAAVMDGRTYASRRGGSTR